MAATFSQSLSMMILEREKMTSLKDDLINDVRHGNISVELAASILKGLESFNPSKPQVTNKEDAATVKQAMAFKELSRRLVLPVEFVIDHFPAISEILTWKPTKEVFYP